MTIRPLFAPDRNDSYFVKAGKTIANHSLGEIGDLFPPSSENLTFSIGGGCFRSYFFKEKATDIDIFILSSKAAAVEYLKELRKNLVKAYPTVNFEAIAQVSLELPPQNLDSISQTQKVVKKFIRFNIPPLEGRNEMPIQMLQFHHEIDDFEVFPTSGRELINMFDVIPACFAIDIMKYSLSGKFVFLGTSQHALLIDSIVNKLLIPNSVRGRLVQPVMALERFYKYTTQYGFTVEKKDMASLAALMAIPSVMNISYESDEDSSQCSDLEF